MINLRIDKGSSYRYNKNEFGFKINKFLAKFKDFKHQINIEFNYGYNYFQILIFWGKCLPHPDFLDFNNWSSGDKIKCYNDEETVLLRQDQEYTLRKLTWKNGGDGFMYPEVSLKEFKEHFTYDAGRFVEQKEEIYE